MHMSRWAGEGMKVLCISGNTKHSAKNLKKRTRGPVGIPEFFGGLNLNIFVT